MIVSLVDQPDYRAYVYVLLDGDRPFYVGQTQDVSARHKCHCRKYGDKVTLLVVDGTNSYQEVTRLEKTWLSYIEDIGHITTNKSTPCHATRGGYSVHYPNRVNRDVIGLRVAK